MLVVVFIIEIVVILSKAEILYCTVVPCTI